MSLLILEMMYNPVHRTTRRNEPAHASIRIDDWVTFCVAHTRAH
jgi:hypothetical protein